MISMPAVLLGASVIFALFGLDNVVQSRRLRRENDKREGDPNWAFALPRFRRLERDYGRSAWFTLTTAPIFAIFAIVLLLEVGF